MGVTELRADMDDVVRRYEEGEFSTQIAEDYDVAGVTVVNYLRRRGVTIRPKGHDLIGHTKRLLTPEQIDEARRLYEEGKTSRELADRFGVSKGTILRWLRGSVEMRPAKRVRFKEKVVTSSGYLSVWLDPDDPMAEMRRKYGYVLEHRLVVAREIGRPLLDTETVHHRNGDRQDNRPDNLELRQGRHGNGQSWCCADCGSRNVVAC